MQGVFRTPRPNIILVALSHLNTENMPKNNLKLVNKDCLALLVSIPLV